MVPAPAELYGGRQQAREGGVMAALLLGENGDWYSGEDFPWLIHAMTHQLATLLSG